MPKSDANEMEHVCDLPNGFALYRKANGVGGYTYWSDEIGGGVFVWDTCTISSSTLLAAIVEDSREQVKLAHQKKESL